MAKYVQPIFDVYGVAGFKNQVTFDTSVFLTGATHISSPATSTADNPYALIVESVGSNVVIKNRQLGDMAWEDAGTWDASLSAIRTDITNLESSVGALDVLTQIHDSSIGELENLTAIHDASLGFLEDYRIIQDVSIDANWQRWIDSRRTGFVDNTETTLSFTPGSRTFTITPTGTEWSYYRNGVKHTITGSKSVVIGAAADRYYITIDGTDGTLLSSTTPWDLDTQVVLVAYIDWDSTNSPQYLIGEERHTMLIDRQIHKYLHETRGTQFVSGGQIIGPDVSAGDVTVTDANNTFGMPATEIADEDLFQTLPSLTRPDGTGTDYVVFFRTGGNLSDWRLESTPLPEGATYIQYDNGTTMVDATPGKYVNSYVMFTNLSSSSGAPQYAILPGQGQYDDLDSAIDENPASFDFTGLPIAEYVIAYQLTWEVSTGYTNTDGRVALASTPKRIRVNATTASAISTESHNDLIGLQGGNATERYHLSLAQFNDYVGKSYVDSSLSTRDTRMDNIDSSISDLDTLTQEHTADIAQLDASVVRIDAYQAIQDASIAAVGGAWQPYVDGSLAARDAEIAQLDASIVRTDAYQAIQDASISANESAIADNAAEIVQLDASVVRIDAYNAIQDASISANESDIADNATEIAQLDASVVRIDAYNAIQDASIAALEVATIQTWNGLTTSVDNSVGLGGTLNIDTEIITGGNLFQITGDTTILGDLTVDGSVAYINTVDLNVSDNIITVNSGETGPGVSKGYAGIKVDRGPDSSAYMFVFAESSDTFRIGIQQESGLPGDTQAVATRQDEGTIIVSGVPYWNGTDYRFDTAAGFTFDAGRLTVADLTLSGLSVDGAEQTALLINTDGSVVYRELGTLAFENAVDFATKAYVDGSLATRDSSIVYLFGEVAQLDASIVRIDASLNDTIEALDLFYSKAYIDGSLAARDADIATLDASIVGINAYQAIQDASIALAIGDFGPLEASIVRIDASLNDHESRIDILEIDVIDLDASVNDHEARITANEAEIAQLDASVINLDSSITSLDSAKVNRAGDTMTGKLTFAVSGFELDSTTITDINISGAALSDNDTTLPTSGAVIDAIEEAIGSRIKAVNGLTEYGDGSLGLGGTLYQDTSINISTHSFSILSPGSNTEIFIEDNNITLDLANVSVNLFDNEFQVSTDAGAGNFQLFGNSGKLDFGGNFIITDSSASPAGLQYDGDYSATYTLRSLVDKEYVDSKAGSSNSAWNGLTESVDGSIGLGGTLRTATTIDISTHSLTLANLVTGTTRLAVISDGGVLKTQQLGTMALETATDYVLRTLFDASVAALTVRINNHDTSILSLNGLIQTNITDITNLESSVGALDTLTQSHTASIAQLDASVVRIDAYNAIQDASIAALEAATIQTWNGLTTSVDNSVGLGGTLDIATTITASATETLSISGLVTSSDDTPFAMVQESAGGPIRTRELGSIAWAATTDYVPVTGGNFSGNVTFDASLIVNGVAVFKNNVFFDGSAYFTDVETIDVSSAYIHLNTGLVGAPPSNLQSGIVVGRGSASPYAFVYDETTQTFRVGIASFTGSQYDDASTQAVATREDNPIDFGIPYWNETADRFDTASGLTFNNGALNLDGSLSVDGLFLGTALGTSATEQTALFTLPTTGEVVTRELGTLAFENVADFASKAYVDGSLATRDAEITAVENSVADLSTGKLDAVANTTGVSGSAQIYSGEADNVAYIKQIVAGVGATITQDSSTITIGVTGAMGYVSKFAGAFTPTGTSETITAATHGLGTGPFNISVYEDGEGLVYTGVSYASNGDVTLSWSAGALTGDCSVFITG